MKQIPKFFQQYGADPDPVGSGTFIQIRNTFFTLYVAKFLLFVRNKLYTYSKNK